MSEGLYASLSAMTCAIGTRPLWTPTRSCTTSRNSLCRRFTIMLMYSLLSVPRPLLDHEELRHPADQVGPAWEERKRHYDSLLRTPWQCLLLQRKARLPVQPHLTTLASIPVQMGLLQLELLSSIFVFFLKFSFKGRSSAVAVHSWRVNWASSDIWRSNSCFVAARSPKMDGQEDAHGTKRAVAPQRPHLSVVPSVAVPWDLSLLEIYGQTCGIWLKNTSFKWNMIVFTAVQWCHEVLWSSYPTHHCTLMQKKDLEKVGKIHFLPTFPRIPATSYGEDVQWSRLLPYCPLSLFAIDFLT